MDLRDVNGTRVLWCLFFVRLEVWKLKNDIKAKSNLTEDMKNTDMLYLVGTMNTIKAQSKEIVFSELIYV